MLQVKIGVQLASLRLPLRKGLLTAKEMGAAAVEIDARHDLRPEILSHTGVRQIRKLLDDLDLRVSAIGYRTRRGYQVQDDLEPRIEATKRALKLAYELGTNVVVNHIGRVPPDDDTAATSILVEALADLGRYSQRVGAFLAAETGTESGAALAKLIARLPPGSIGVDFNPAQLILHSHSPGDALRALGPLVMHVHANDGTRDLSLGRGIEVQLGRGSAEFPELLAVLEEHQYRGYITVERRDADDPVGEIAQAVQFLQNL
ncbi:MAG: sugar phosphate isomerase/epimerase family protein [Pirellulaceae bacterium]